MLRTVIFDLDGTLLNTLGDLAESVNYALRVHGLPERTYSEVRSYLGNGIRRLMLQAAGPMVDESHFESVFQTFKAYYVEHCLDTTQPYEGIMPMLKVLHRMQISLAIVSNKLHPAVVELNERFFKDYVQLAIGESAEVRRKPNPDGVLAALKALGSKPDEALYVGDSEVDLATAQAAGLPCALVLWGFRDEEFLRTLPGADIFLREPADLLNLL